MAEVVEAEYPGLSRILSGSVSFPVGVQPGAISLECIGWQSPQGRGNFEIEGSESDRVVFSDCVITNISHADRNGRPVTRVSLKDRRWKWATGRIDGHYNITAGRNTPGNPKTPRELADMLLTAMGEANTNILSMPNVGNPEVRWVAANPARELEELCRLYGLLIGFTTSNAVSLFPVNQGPGLPTLPNEVSSVDSADVRVIPTEFQVLGAPTIYDSIFNLKPVGYDTDGALKEIDNLSYKPVGKTWGSLILSKFATLSKDAKELARRDIGRLYRVENIKQGAFTSGFAPLGYTGTAPTSMDEIDVLPYTAAQVSLEGVLTRGRAYVVGEHYASFQTKDKTSRNDSPVETSVSVDNERKLIRLGTTVLADVQCNLPNLHLVAGAHVVLASGVRDRYERTLASGDPNASGLPQAEIKESIQLRKEIQVIGGGAALDVSAGPDNQTAVDAEADYYLDAMNTASQTRPSGSTTGYGIHSVGHHGNRHEIAYRWGSGPPSTQIGYNVRVLGGAISYAAMQARNKRWKRGDRPDRDVIDKVKFDLGLSETMIA